MDIIRIPLIKNCNNTGIGTNDLFKDGFLILIIRSRSVICKQACMTLA